MRIYAIVFLLFINVLYAKAQEFGGNPSSVKFKQINTDTACIIFPEGLDSAAIRVAAYIHAIPTTQQRLGNSIGRDIRKISIVLQPTGTLSNAYVGLGPWRSEFFLMPPQDAFELGAQNWPYDLSVHEFRHVQQFSNFNRGWSKTFKTLFGEYGQSLANAAAIPDWFFEGDAVYNETLLSGQGRGRLPFFFNDYKSIFLDGRQYSYMQLRNGSYRNFIPDHYHLGYLLVAYGKEKYGNEFWKNVTQDAAAFHPVVYPFQNAVKKYAGIPFEQFQANALQYYADTWRKAKSRNSDIKWITQLQPNAVTHYKQAYKYNDSSIIALKSGYKDVPAFYHISQDGTEEKIATKDISTDDYYSYNNGRIIYAAYQPDARWGNREYSIIKWLDVKTGEEHTIGNHTKYFSPDISHNGNYITAVEMNASLQSSLVLMDAGGNILQSWRSAENTLYSQPKFTAGDSSICVLVRDNNGYMGIEQKKIGDSAATMLVPMTNKIIGFPVIDERRITYTRTAGGNDELWTYSFAEKKEYHLASAATGVYQGFVDDSSVVTSVFTANGYRLAKLPLNEYPLYEGPALSYFPNEKQVMDSLLYNKRSFTVTTYRKTTRFFNFHSWAPSLEPPDYQVTVYGENVLNTFQSQLYYQYNSNEQFNRVGYTAIYGGWYLQPLADVNETFNRRIQLNSDTALFFNETNASVGLQLPLNFTYGNFYRYLSSAVNYHYSNVHYTGLAKSLFRNNSVHYVEASVAFSAQRQKALQNIYTHFGGSLFVRARSAFAGITANQLLATASLYLPGVGTNHNLVINGAFQARDTAGDYFYNNSFPFSRGYEAFDYPRMYKIGVNYHLPLLYPDWGFANIVFFNRIRLNAFFDHTTARSLRQQRNYMFNTAGAELYFDTKWWNQQPLTFGIRYSNLLNENYRGLNKSQWEFILPVIILN